jgi:hypothetical protein
LKRRKGDTTWAGRKVARWNGTRYDFDGQSGACATGRENDFS